LTVGKNGRKRLKWRDRLRGGVDLATTVAGVRFPNPLLLASGILNETGASMARAAREGAGGVVTKSMSLKPRAGHPGPNVVEVDGGLLNAMGLPGPGLDHFAREVEDAKRGGAVLVGSVFGGTAEEFAEAARRMAALGTPALELNVSCPHAKGYGSEIGCDPGRLREVVAAVKDAVKVPIWVKLTPNTDDVARLARVAVEAGADALVATNTLKAIAIEPDVRRPVLGNRVGGLSGHALKPVALRAVWDCWAADLKVPIVASGGIYTARDVLEYAMAGAAAFQVGTAVMHEGWGVFEAIKSDLGEWMEAEGVSSLRDVTGAAHVK
jgi:dihydroorotate dehydrogenase (NAD+) catalytic subunit